MIHVSWIVLSIETSNRHAIWGCLRITGNIIGSNPVVSREKLINETVWTWSKFGSEPTSKQAKKKEIELWDRKRRFKYIWVHSTNWLMIFSRRFWKKCPTVCGFFSSRNWNSKQFLSFNKGFWAASKTSRIYLFLLERRTKYTQNATTQNPFRTYRRYF